MAVVLWFTSLQVQHLCCGLARKAGGFIGKRPCCTQGILSGNLKVLLVEMTELG